MSRLLLTWYDSNRRILPWRARDGEEPNPYGVWLSEIMLQQTTVAAVVPYFEKFMARWPNVNALAQAPEAEILSAWAGLGYYARARNLIACAKILSERGFPQDEIELRALPGIGAYTAAAVAAIAFGRRAVVVDGNIERIVSRLFVIETPLPQARKEIAAAMDGLTPMRRAGDFAQAMMDLGATICTPKKPDCVQCPFQTFCAASNAGAPESYPKKRPRAPKPQKFGHVFVARRADGAFLLRTRPPKGLLGGMSEFYGGEWTNSIQKAAPPFPAKWRAAGAAKHVFTHFSLTLEIWACDALPKQKAPPGGRWTAEADMEREALPGLMRKVERRARLAFPILNRSISKQLP